MHLLFAAPFLRSFPTLFFKLKVYCVSLKNYVFIFQISTALFKQNVCVQMLYFRSFPAFLKAKVKRINFGLLLVLWGFIYLFYYCSLNQFFFRNVVRISGARKKNENKCKTFFFLLFLFYLAFSVDSKKAPILVIIVIRRFV